MRVSERATPVAAAVAAVSTLACCLPFSFVGALGIAGLSVFAAKYRLWLIGAAVVLLIVGALQVYRKNSCERRSRVSVVTFWAAVAVVVAVFFFPQLIASLLAG